MQILNLVRLVRAKGSARPSGRLGSLLRWGAVAPVVLAIAGWAGPGHAQFDIQEYFNAFREDPDSGCEQENIARPPFPSDREVKVLALGVYGSDEEPLITEAQLSRFFNEDDYQGAFSVAQQVRRFTSGQVRLRFVTRIVQLPHPVDDYHDSESLIIENDAINALIATGFDLNTLDKRTDFDLFYPIDIVIVGDGEGFIGSPATPGVLYGPPHPNPDPNDPNFGRLPDPDFTFLSYAYSYIRNLRDTPGVIMHELGHNHLGWTEYYANAGIGDFGTGFFDMMAHGFEVPPNAFSRSCAGWTRTFDLADFPLGTRFEVPANDNVVLRHRKAETDREYFLMEAVTKAAQNKEMPDEGLLIWRVNETTIFQIFDEDSTDFHRVSLEQADGKFGIETIQHDGGGPGDAFKKGDAFGADTSPSSRRRTGRVTSDGAPTGLEVSGISAVGPRMSFLYGTAGTAQNGATVKLFGDSSTVADASGKLVGIRLQDRPGGLVYMPLGKTVGRVPLDSFTAENRQTRTQLVSYYESRDCSGSPYSWPGYLYDTGVILEEGGDWRVPTRRGLKAATWYAPVGAAETRTIQSILYGTNCVNWFGFTAPMQSLVAVEMPDFKPPFSFPMDPPSNAAPAGS